MPVPPGEDDDQPRSLAVGRAMTGTRHFAVTLLRSAALCAEGVTEIVKIGLAYPAKRVELVVG